MRLIHDAKAADIISNMEVGFEQQKTANQFYTARQEDAAVFGLKIFDFNEYRKANTKADGTINTNDYGFRTLSYQPPLNFTDPVYLKEFAAKTGYFRNDLDVYITQIKSLIPKFESSIAYLQNTYHLK
jgi:hypothetical protein